MRYWCFECEKSVSNEIPYEVAETIIIRAAFICPECIEKLQFFKDETEEKKSEGE